MQTVRQLEFALFDMLLHSTWDPRGGGAWPSPQALVEAVRREIAVVPRAPYDRSLQSFGHIFAGGYAAGYYSYKWAEVLSADAYSLFEEHGVLSPAAGARFRDEVLARGGSRPAMESFVAFRGRAPQLDALLRHNGMVASAAVGGAMAVRSSRRLAFACGALAGMIAAGAAAQTPQVYRYVDPNGRIVYSDHMPPPNAKNVESKRLTPNFIETDKMPLEAQQARRSAFR